MDTNSKLGQPAVSERVIIFLIASVQFISILEFMMVMPLGPDFAEALNIPVSHIGFIGGSYTAAAAVAGLMGSMWIERFDRRKALAFLMTGLLIATAGAGLAVDMESLIAVRILAGCFGGPAMALSLAIVADVIPAARRGKAMGAVMASFAVASVIGVPAGLELAHYGGWRMPFFAIAALGVLVVLIALKKLPSMRGHIEAGAGIKPSSLLELLVRRDVQLSIAIASTTMFGLFLVVPNVAPYVLSNLHYPRERLGLLYLVGGVFSFVTMRFVGGLVDRFGAALVGTFGAALFAIVLIWGFLFEPPTSQVMGVFVLLMMASSFRNIPFQTLTSQVPSSHERAKFMSLQSSLQHIATASGAVVSSMILSDNADGSLAGMPNVAGVAILTTVVSPFLLFAVQKIVRERKQ